MATVTFTIPDAVAIELGRIATENGFPNAKAMVAAYLRATIAGSREQAQRKALPQINVSDVTIS